MKTVSPYLHALEGRLRIKVPEVKGSSRRARDIEHLFHPLGPIEHVSANPVTGNVLVLYDAGRTTTGEIVEAMHAVGYLCEATSAPVTASPAPLWSNLLLRATTEFALQKLIAALI